MAATGRQLRWGVLGVAKINDRLKPAFHASKTVRLQAIASRSLLFWPGWRGTWFQSEGAMSGSPSPAAAAVEVILCGVSSAFV